MKIHAAMTSRMSKDVGHIAQTLCDLGISILPVLLGQKEQQKQHE